MDTALRPRDIQARIRSGRSVDEVAAAAGMSAEMVARFAAPVLAEREYVAGQAMTAPVRRRGETSAHRKLRVAVSERLMSNRVDMDQVSWDSARMEDGRWAVIAHYQVGDASHEAVFHFDVPGRFSIAGNTDARWLLGEDVDDADDEPTLEIGETGSDAVTSAAAPPQVEVAAAADPQQVEQVAPAPEPVVALVAEPPDPVTVAAETDTDQHDAPSRGLDMLYDILDRAGTEYTEDSVEIPLGTSDTRSHTAVDSGADGVSDAAAVPDTAGGDYAPTLAASDYPVEPSLFDDEPDLAQQTEPAQRTEPAQGTPAATPRKRRRSLAAVPEDVVDAPNLVPAARTEPPRVETPSPVDDATAAPAELASATEAPAEPNEPTVETPRKKPRSKRASVPSWDEIMFGSPRSKG